MLATCPPPGFGRRVGYCTSRGPPTLLRPCAHPPGPPPTPTLTHPHALPPRSRAPTLRIPHSALYTLILPRILHRPAAVPPPLGKVQPRMARPAQRHHAEHIGVVRVMQFHLVTAAVLAPIGHLDEAQLPQAPRHLAHQGLPRVALPVPPPEFAHPLAVLGPPPPGALTTLLPIGRVGAPHPRTALWPVGRVVLAPRGADARGVLPAPTPARRTSCTPSSLDVPDREAST